MTAQTENLTGQEIRFKPPRDQDTRQGMPEGDVPQDIPFRLDSADSRLPVLEPVIVSASRSTDIPAFYAEWFFHRLEDGFSHWINPFNNKKFLVSYKKCRFIVFWSKNPEPLLPYLPRLERLNIGYYLQYTLNDYEAERYENVPPLRERISTFRRFSERAGRSRIIWRFDPLLLTGEVGADDLLGRIGRIAESLKGCTEKLVFSFADIDIYRKVQTNLREAGISYQNWDERGMEDFAARLQEMNLSRKWGFRLATCAEKIDLSRYRIEHNSCIDRELIARLSGGNEELLEFLGYSLKTRQASTGPVQTELFALPDAPVIPDDTGADGDIRIEGLKDLYAVNNTRKKSHKDPGQREFCNCCKSKDIGQYNTCPHQCIYCYANLSPRKAVVNYLRRRGSPADPGIISQ